MNSPLTRLLDPEMSVRRKTVFLLNTLITPTTPNPTTAQHNPHLLISSEPAATASPVTSATRTASSPTPTPATSVTVHPSSESSVSPATVPRPNLHTVDEPNANNPNPIHDNSHAAHLKDPSRSNTSRIALEAFARYAIIQAVISAVTNPLPYGEDGENDEPDVDFEEKSMQWVII